MELHLLWWDVHLLHPLGFLPLSLYFLPLYLLLLVDFILQQGYLVSIGNIFNN